MFSVSYGPVSFHDLVAACDPRGPRHRDKRHGLDDARPPIEPQRSPDVGAVRFAPAVPHEGVVDKDLAIDPRAGELEAERAGHRRFGPAGVGRAMTPRVAPD